MRKIALVFASSFIAAAALVLPPLAIAQVGGGGSGGGYSGGAIPQPIGPGGALPQPTISCGTSPVVNIGGPYWGKVTCGTGAVTTATITWGPARQSAAAVCNLTGETTALTTITVNNATTLTWNFASTASTVWDYWCPSP